VINLMFNRLFYGFVFNFDYVEIFKRGVLFFCSLIPFLNLELLLLRINGENLS
jgi:hypothetical protein